MSINTPSQTPSLTVRETIATVEAYTTWRGIVTSAGGKMVLLRRRTTLTLYHGARDTWNELSAQSRRAFEHGAFRYF